MRASRRRCTWLPRFQTPRLRRLLRQPAERVVPEWLGEACYRSVHRAVGPDHFLGEIPDASLTHELRSRVGGQHTFNRHAFSPKGHWDEWTFPAEETMPHRIMARILAAERGGREPELIDEISERVLTNGEIWRRQSPHNLARATQREDIAAYLAYCEGMLAAARENERSAFDEPIAVALGPDYRIYKIGDGRHRLAASRLQRRPIRYEVRNIHRSLLESRLMEAGRVSTRDTLVELLGAIPTQCIEDGDTMSAAMKKEGTS